MQTLNFEPNFGPVLKSSGLNFGSELNYGIPTHSQSSLFTRVVTRPVLPP
jgi:hypothetical protein